MNIRTLATVLAAIAILSAPLAVKGEANATSGAVNGATATTTAKTTVEKNAGTTAGTTGGTTDEARDGATRPATPLACRGETVDLNARIRYRTEILINAPLSTVWRLQTDVERWPTWQPPVATAERIDRGALRKGSQFRWTTPVPATDLNPATTLVITSTVHQLKRKSCLRWSGPAIGQGLRIDRGVHVWTFTKVRGGVLVRTEETWRGAQVEADITYSTAALGFGLETWLQDLRATAETSPRQPRK